MFSVYLLQSLRNPTKSYVGLTTRHIRNRLQEHNDGLSQSTKHDRPWKLIYYEQFYCKLCSEKREQHLKSGIGYKFRKILLKYQSEL